MRVLAHLRAASKALLNRAALNRELDEEIRSHIHMHADDLERGGLSRAEAERQARLAFGGGEKFKEECRDATYVSFVESLAQDIRFGLRMLRKNPGVALIVVGSLLIGETNLDRHAAIRRIRGRPILSLSQSRHADRSEQDLRENLGGLSFFRSGALK
jgi:hypothetical protein